MSLILVDGLKDRPGTGGPKFPNGLHLPAGIGITGDGHINMAGVCTFSGNVTIGGTLTYEDVTNIDSVGVVTARSGVNVSGGEFKVGTAITVGSAGVSTFFGSVNLNRKTTVNATLEATEGLNVTAGIVTVNDYIQHAGDTNTAIRFPTADTVTVETSGSERFRIASTGLVGLSTANPLAPLHAFNSTNNTIAILESGDATSRLRLKDNTGEAFVAATGDDLIFANTSSVTERLRIDSSGRLLLGTTTEGNGNADNLTIADSAACGITIRSASNNVGSIYFSDDTSGTGEYMGMIGFDHSTNALTLSTNATTALTISSSQAATFASDVKTLRSGQANVIIGSSDAGGAALVLDGDSDGDASGGDYSYLMHNTSGDLVISVDNPAGGGSLYLKRNGDSDYAVLCYATGATELRYQNTKKFETTNDGVSISGIATVSQGMHFQGMLREDCNIVANKLSAGTNIDLEDGMVHYYSTNETTTATPNIRWNSSFSLNNKMSVGEVITVTIIYKPNGAGYYAQLAIDGSASTEEWNGGSAPSSANAGGYDVLTHTIIKTGNGTYIVLSNVQNYA